ncbi:MAG: peptide chain release factor 3 [Hirschia sp.]|nr:peptide chain release factor 3 [Hirschia sp.]MBF19354.1 peptide chain release factor 3 [Hirschia sp.]
MALSPAEEASRRRTFAIISHPDAGKTTLTENLLLTGGAIRLAGQVKARGERRRTTSDWMKIEQDRGISVASSVMTFEYENLVFNLLDTPGHEDFSEDTYRTLTAADAAVMVLDAAKGIEPQTLKLFEVCRLRDIPIVTFINKMDREAVDPFELLDEIQDKLALDCAPLFWPQGSGDRFRGMADVRSGEFLMYKKKTAEDEIDIAGAPRTPLDGNAIHDHMGDDEFEEITENAEMAREMCPPFDEKSFLEGHLTPVVFGTALRHFGVRELLDTLTAYAPPPRPQKAEVKGAETIIENDYKEVAGFIFKVQANMDPNHRDRIAFLKMVSGKFKRGMKLKTTAGKQINVASPVMFMAQDREIADEAFAGDVIGVPNHGALRVGDSLSESGAVQFGGIPNFAPEILRRARVKDPMKAKHLRKALEGLAEEGVTQLFTPALGADMIVGAVGALQIDVMAERVSAENNLEVAFEQGLYNVARWISSDDKAKLEAFVEKNRVNMATDIDGAPVFLGKNAWDVGYVAEKNPDIRFMNTKERS